MNTNPTYTSLMSAVCSVLLFTSLTAPDSWGATSSAPGKITYQGFLTDQSGVPIGKDGPVNQIVIFRIYGSQSGDDLKWSSQQTVTVDKGHFSVLLGEGGLVQTVRICLIQIYPALLQVRMSLTGSWNLWWTAQKLLRECNSFQRPTRYWREKHRR